MPAHNDIFRTWLHAEADPEIRKAKNDWLHNNTSEFKVYEQAMLLQVKLEDVINNNTTSSSKKILSKLSGALNTYAKELIKCCEIESGVEFGMEYIQAQTNQTLLNAAQEKLSLAYNGASQETSQKNLAKKSFFSKVATKMPQDNNPNSEQKLRQ
jgi:hypothetical protein